MENENSEFDGFVEWDIENFSSWSREIHGRRILSPNICKLPRPVNVRLYPKGNNGYEERIIVDVSEISDKYPCELTFMGSDGSLIESVKWKDELNSLISGPKFKEIVSQTRKNELLHKDRLTLQLCINGLEESYKLRSKLGVFCTYVKLTPEKIRDFTMSQAEFLFASNLPQNNCMKGFVLYATTKTSTRLEDAKLVFTLSPNSHSKDAFIRSCVSICNEDDVTIRCEDIELVLKDRMTTISDSLSLTELIKDKCSLHIRLKIIFDDNQNCTSFRFNKKVDLVTKAIDPPAENVLKSAKPIQTALSKELMCLYQDHDYADFHLRCGSVCFPVHKCILSARSRVFKSMLSTDMKEATSGSMDIPDLDAHTLGRFLAFLYTETVEDLDWDAALKLYYAADKYHVPTLKGECKSFLETNITIQNVCAVMSLADKHRDSHLASVSIDFFLENFNDVMRSEEWEEFMKSDPNLLLSIVTLLGKNNCVGKIKVVRM